MLFEGRLAAIFVHVYIVDTVLVLWNIKCTVWSEEEKLQDVILWTFRMTEVPTTPRKDDQGIGASGIPTSHAAMKRRYTTSPSPKNKHNNVENDMNSRLSLDGKISTGIQSILNRVSGSNITSLKSHSHLASFYKQQVKELNDLQTTLYNRKMELDELRDNLEVRKDQLKEQKYAVGRESGSKNTKEQQLRLRQTELSKLKEDLEARKKFLLDGFKLHLKQMEVENQTKKNKLAIEYRDKLEAVKRVKIKKMEDEKDQLAKEVDVLREKIANNDSTLDDMLRDVTQKYENMKEPWLKSFEVKWKENVEINEKCIQEITELRKELEENLQPKAEKLKSKFDSLKEQRDELIAKLKQQQKEHRKIEEEISQKKTTLRETEEREASLKEEISKTESDLKELNEILIKEETLRRSLHNKLQELRGNIRVFCRIRPTLEHIEDPDTGHITVNPFDNNYGVQSMEVMKQSSFSRAPVSFKFDKIFDTGESNDEVFKEVGQLVQSSLDGYNVCIFAYGQTGSGKTYTMLHPNDGVIPATISHIFDWVENLKERGWEYKISCQFVEIYNENIVDLLRSNENGTPWVNAGKCDVRHDHDLGKTTITNATTCVLESKESVDKVLKRATKLRSTASTLSNEHSSRSHSIFIIELHGVNHKTKEESCGVLNLVDLAGSERVHSSQVTGERLRETQNINRSLSCLGDVIYALNDKNTKRHIPFRNSKLTYLLQYSLVGNSKTLMFVNISPSSSHINETINSLRFASKVNATRMAKHEV
ncbi:Kar3p KNAG_0A07880 [Huiozyma naganishii CBS 8797]|uniref:Kinesin-like protein n=1 Tax=Huiozyma naganishii (strain ATCC MYA-139 / BCRC 22969 / CBS 8797 / KCTC 17520 / NBRC 10181 / NCYC 3082 / Yp74L-3) TaxID=1071383 RepID=J7R0V7_HUIN7|nr:hypothetical protein KNAG_0A07880 [Kazachstania naganishii CBS 8797]CCK68440.1 hypothetical protein KNAG_0A07880 [Kazachstania naganishii CBS 8797]